MTYLDVQRRDDGIVVVAITNPPANALTTPVFNELRDLARDLSDSPPGVVGDGRPTRFAVICAMLGGGGGVLDQAGAPLDLDL